MVCVGGFLGGHVSDLLCVRVMLVLIVRGRWYWLSAIKWISLTKWGWGWVVLVYSFGGTFRMSDSL